MGQQILKAEKYRGTTSKMKSIKLCWRLILPIILLRIIVLSEESFCSSCNKPRFKTYFTNTEPEKSHNLNFFFENGVYLFSFKTWHEKYTRSTEEIRSRFHICRCV